MMSLIQDIAKELLGMFLADARLTGAILVLVLFSAGLVFAFPASPLIGGAALLFGCLAVLAEAAVRGARGSGRESRPREPGD